MKQMEQQQRQKNQQVAAVVAGNGSVSQRKRTTFSKLRQKQGGGDSGFIEMKEFPRSKSKDNTATKYQKQGLGGYEDEEADYSEINLDVNMK